MNNLVNHSKLKTSWTKYDIVQVMEVISNIDTLQKFISKEATIDEPVLKSFLGMTRLSDPIPQYWIDIQKYPDEKKLFALFSVIFTHSDIIEAFAIKYSTGDKKGVFKIEPGKQYTNIRSALIEAGAAPLHFRKAQTVPYDFRPIFRNSNVGKLFRSVLEERVYRMTKKHLSEVDFFEFCNKYKFNLALGLTEEDFQLWLTGNRVEVEIINGNIGFVSEVQINDFISIKETHLKFDRSKEIYFLGENGDGKSLVLMGIYLAFKGNYILEKTEQGDTGKIGDIIRDNAGVTLKGKDSNSIDYSIYEKNYLKNFFAYGTHRGRYSTDSPEQYGFMSLFDSDQTLQNPVSWLKDQKLKAYEESGNKENITDANSTSLLFIKQIFFELLERNVEIQIADGNVSFIEKGVELSFDKLSEGYKSVIIFVTDLLFRLTQATNSQVSNAIQSTGVVIVDEIDLHLHPKWQREIIGKLRNLFPNIQFIFTTHSPIVIQGASDDAILFRVYRNQNNAQTCISEPYYRNKLDHLMINSLLTSPLFGLEDARMDSDNVNADTSDSYLLYRINRQIKEKLKQQKLDGKHFLSNADIDRLIEETLNDELKKDDTNC